MEILSLINQERSVVNVAKLKMSERLATLARQRSAAMVTLSCPLSHYVGSHRPYTVDQLFESRGEVIFANLSGSANKLSIETNPGDAGRVVSAFMNSESHREVLLNGVFRYVGINKATEENRTVITGIFSDLK